MERLTDKKEADAQRREYENRLKNGYPRSIPEERFLRLASYEDTGLEPEGIKERLEAYKELFFERADLYNEIGYIEHIKELIQAEKDGRLVVLNEPRQPLVWGNDVHDSILCPNCNHDLMGGFPETESCETPMYQCPYCGQAIDDSTALTREEAEAALKKRKEADNETD